MKVRHVGEIVWTFNDLKNDVSKEVIKEIYDYDKQTMIKFEYNENCYSITETLEDWVFDTKVQAINGLIEFINLKIKRLDGDKKYYIEKIKELRERK